MGFGHGCWGGMGGWGLLGGLIGLLFFLGLVAALAALIVWLWRRAADGSTTGSRKADLPRELTAREILEARYARGEITREEFLQLREDLS